MKNPDGRYLLPTTFTYKGGEVQVKLTGAQIARLNQLLQSFEDQNYKAFGEGAL